MSNIDTNFHQLFQPKSQVNEDNENPTLLLNRLTPTDDQIKDWLQSPQIKQWLTKLLMGIPNNLKVEVINTIIKNVIQNPDKDYRVQFGSSTIGVDVLRCSFGHPINYRKPVESKLLIAPIL
ncbi:hypothetical protein GNF10_35470 [Nostoc sp. UCD121]|uniref:hypothetical protein n=1 Tax=unclassified Nostoc TaxID=2593658 RepID=UPI001627A531|nr:MULTISPECIES: hypothetical protein [unclassified Nostoc]MBC1224750.1 hypothetical protein [Nostoc sp. UCD120]MBC1281086.1 hypothetical protein [Nostoc sp. UCD121]MBC1298653.1 hypothetical protein [Nostoc sp. UCD122]